ncbi:hypothetical protein QN382_22415 [Pseudomonas sp. 10B1]|uniref:hypothetical protein n=1 Tax=unclassified Pseudomonas TaxID=196821 RepID=UPI002AB4AA22|nr:MULTISPECIES: hypothetical protein [unclassified Pseudomonas]MDY7561282.1 hypothetical protein [Pseudomonas sp. AB6]MEA9977024.1 hypothetical protein [Pseudomonas sp. RTS4]MEA9997359.1 hypothetical protein [Pseudomonas sp. AA4]MEB0087711.1 hypothetical protein [Pseudomonas sp. RTI1]MEB0127708.1 hypothetical protein [Pseudomonas sp. CCC1.2]
MNSWPEGIPDTVGESSQDGVHRKILREDVRSGVFIFSSRWHFKVKAVVSHFSDFKFNKKVSAMDEYQEELLEYRASELDPVEPADDATEL